MSKSTKFGERRPAFLLTACVAALVAAEVCAEDWPTYRHDMARSGITSERIRPPLVESWVFKAAHPPQPAWGDPNPRAGYGDGSHEGRRVHFDDVFQPVASGGSVFFGSSADNKVSCLDAETGRVRWTRITGGPIRLAPAIVGRRLFVGSDDGHVYCLNVDDGSTVWKFRAAPEDRRVLGHGKMISLWPVRTGVVVDDGVAYFGSGIFPAEGVFLFAANADDGRELWRNDASGEEPQSRVSPQGYMLASKTTLYAPMGRVSPAAFDRRNGHLLHQTSFGPHVGGTYALLAGDDLYTGTNSIGGYNSKTGDKFEVFEGRKLVVTDEMMYVAGNRYIAGLDRKTRSARWKTACPCNQSLILAGDLLFAGGENRVVAIEALSGKELWAADVNGTAKGLAVANGKLLVSTDHGMIYCFTARGTKKHGPVSTPVVVDPYAGSPRSEMFQRAAEFIMKATQIKRGYCLVLGCETGQLALELAKRTEWMIYVVDPDAGRVARARKALDEAGVYGARVCVDQWPLDKIPYADYFANLVVSESALVHGELPANSAEMFRMLKPVGGKAILGQPSERPGVSGTLEVKALRRWLEHAKLEDGRITTEGGNWLTITRGPLPGAGRWTHQYANPGNVACSDDQRVTCPLGVLWFGNPGPKDALERHLRAAAPLSIDGRLFVPGEDSIEAYDAYNGLRLWRREIPGVGRDNVSHNAGNMALNQDGLFVAVGKRCLRLDPATGETKNRYELPVDEGGKHHVWGYVACVGHRLFGSRVADASTLQRAKRRGSTFKDRPWDDALSQAGCLFAFDIQTGKQLWIHRGKPFPQNSISIGDGLVFFVSPDVTADQRQQAIDQRRRWIATLSETEQAKVKELTPGDHVGRVVALDLQTGHMRWQKPIDLTGCGGEGHGQINWTRQEAKLATMYANGVLVIFGVYLDGHHWSEFFDGRFASRRIVALRGEEGAMLWSKPVGFRVRPLIIGDTLHAEPWKFNLHTGEPEMQAHPITGQPVRWQFARPGHHCGSPSASPNGLFFRSFTLAYYDLANDFGTIHFGGQRPGCWINAIPAAGLVLVPEASAGCVCTFPNACTVAFQPTSRNKAWGMYSAPGPTTPVKRLAINLGMAGDRKDVAGNLWFGFPRPVGKPPPTYGPGDKMLLRFDLAADFYPGGGFDRTNSTYTRITGTDDPWLLTSTAHGLRKLVIPLLGKNDTPVTYRVRLAFTAPAGDPPGQRVFDIRLQGKRVEENFDIAGSAGGAERALFKEFSGVEVRDNLELELVSKVVEPTERQRPLLQAIEMVSTTRGRKP
ncbi:MAG: PQQ-binding-like beta-propeller repeat protein [Pirellulales bacterium]